MQRKRPDAHKAFDEWRVAQEYEFSNLRVTMSKEFSVFYQPLRPLDTAMQTEGCRHTNPIICSKNRLPKVCAFVRPDQLCVCPPRTWKKQFGRLNS
jgi:hypothetical protein